MAIEGLGDTASTIESVLGGAIGAGLNVVAEKNQAQLQTSAQNAVSQATSNFWTSHKWEFIMGGILALVIIGVIGFAIFESGKARKQ